MEQAQQNTAQELTAQAIPQQAVEDACFHSPVSYTHLTLPTNSRV